MIDNNCEPSNVRVRLTDWSESLSERVVRERERGRVGLQTHRDLPLPCRPYLPRTEGDFERQRRSGQRFCPLSDRAFPSAWVMGTWRLVILVSVLFCPVKPSNGLGSRTQALGHTVWCSTEVPTERWVERAGVQCMYRSDKLLSNGPWAAGETQVPISGLDRSIPFRCCQARPAGLGATCTRI